MDGSRNNSSARSGLEAVVSLEGMESLMLNIIEGSWGASIQQLNDMGEQWERVLTFAKCLILEQKYFELIDDGKVMDALQCLRTEIIRLCDDDDRIRKLSSCIVVPSQCVSLKQQSRVHLWQTIQNLVDGKNSRPNAVVDRFFLHIHSNGIFEGCGVCWEYLNGNDHIYEFDPERFSITEVERLATELGLVPYRVIWYNMPHKPRPASLAQLSTDNDVLQMVNYMRENNLDTMHLYVVGTGFDPYNDYEQAWSQSSSDANCDYMNYSDASD